MSTDDSGITPSRLHFCRQREGHGSRIGGHLKPIAERLADAERRRNGHGHDPAQDGAQTGQEAVRDILAADGHAGAAHVQRASPRGANAAEQASAEICEHQRTRFSERTWLRTCLDCGCWRMDDEVGERGKWRKPRA